LMPRKISILGSTGSIGTSTVEVLREHRDRFRVLGLAAGSRWMDTLRQIEELSPEIVSLSDPQAARELRKNLSGHKKVRVLEGPQGLEEVASYEGVDTVVAAISGAAGLVPVIRAIESGKTIALANKEVLVAAGALVTRLARDREISLVPVDSEHSAIFQCLKGESRPSVSRVLLTASGGPFRGLSQDDLSSVTPERALAHPNWRMGAKITIDSSTLMNKGLEVIEAHWLFSIPYHQIEVVVHPQSVVHSMVEFCDGSTMAQLGPTDMRVAILYALTHPDRLPIRKVSRVDLPSIGTLSFERPDLKTFRCLAVAIESGRRGRTYPAVLSAANEVAVARFLSGSLSFCEIPRLLERVLERHQAGDPDRLDDILESDAWARREAENWKVR
jgi:1-deoxy-D-xylulose-5-phosphate reductoisomerase